MAFSTTPSADRRIARATLAMLAVLAVAGCAKEPPPEEEYQSLKDRWTNGTTVARAEAPVPEKTVYSPPPSPQPVESAPRVRPAPARPATALPPALPKPAPQQAARTRPAPPSLAISPPPAEKPSGPAQPASPAPLAPPTALSESDLAHGNLRCGPGADCLAVLRTMIADPTQSWMVRAPSPEEFANGTRLFAYRALKATLDCGKLRFANAELDWAVDTFNGRPEGVDAVHRARVAALAEAVRVEIEAEIKDRC